MIEICCFEGKMDASDMTGGDGGSYDMCECVWSHQAAMERLMRFLRQSQENCDDTQCYENEGGIAGKSTPRGGPSPEGCIVHLRHQT